VSGNTAAVVASHVMAFAFVKLKQAIAERRAKAQKSAAGAALLAADAKPLPPKEKAKYVTELLRDILPAVGCPDDDLPTEREVLRWIRKHRDEPAAKAEGAALGA
jgi:hypothetical protein